MKKLFILIPLLLTIFWVTVCNNSHEILNKTSFGLIQKSEKARSGQSTLKIVTWNIRDLGRTKDAEELYEIANILRDFDLVGIQEVVAKDPAGAQAVAKIADELNRMGSKWDYSISDPTKSPSSNISERYAFLWKTSEVKLVHKPYLDKELENYINREPFIAEFKLKNRTETFFVVNFHSRKYDDNPEEEIIFFKDYPNRLKSERIFILGDFNLTEKHSVWDILYEIGFHPSVTNTPTTLKLKCKNGDYFNYAIDNIFYTKSKIDLLTSGRIDFVGNCKNLEMARRLSDHLPVFLECIIE